MKRLTLWCLVGLSLAACSKKTFTEKVTLHDKEDKDGNPIAGSAETLSPQVLNDGYEAYMLYCFACHGEKGDGYGPAAPNMRPPPRNFARALFKFPGTAFGKLPVDNALDRTIRRGLNGTPMLPWDIPDIERKALISYVKTLSPRWKEEGPPPEIEIAPDPWKGKSKDEAIAMGRQVYHVAVGGAGCNGCHASYETRDTIVALHKAAGADAPTEFSEEMYRTALKPSEYPWATRLGDRRVGCELYFPYEDHKSKEEEEKHLEQMKAKIETLALEVNGQDIPRDTEHKEGWDFSPPSEEGHHHKPSRLVFFGKACDELKADPDPAILATGIHKLLPPDFIFHRVKTAYPVGTMINEGDKGYVAYTEEMQREDLYRTIGVGIGGAAMPGWKGVLEEDKLWGLVYYVQSLANTRDTAAGAATRARLTAQPAWVVPPEQAPAPEGAADAGTK
jgi:mono/diheme cytochrome c family protein